MSRLHTLARYLYGNLLNIVIDAGMSSHQEDHPMHCFENALMRDYLFALARELDPTIARDDLLLEQALNHHDLRTMRALMDMETDQITGLVHQLVGALPIAA